VSLLWPGEPYLDIALTEPPAMVHPIVWMGRIIGLLERGSPRSELVMQLLAGTGIAFTVPAVFSAASWGLGLGLRELGIPVYIIGGAVLLQTMFTAKGLANAAMMTARDLRNEDLETPRLHLRSLVGRDPATLTTPQVAAATVESVAENSTDSYIGPWLAFALFGLARAFAHKAVNTLDSMIGYHGRYECLGKAVPGWTTLPTLCSRD